MDSTLTLRDELDVEMVVDDVLNHAVAAGASDIYFMPTSASVLVKIRINGAQSDLLGISLDLGIQCIARLKVLSGLLTYRTKIAQDGVIRDTFDGVESEMRVSVMPGQHGERVAVRFMNAVGASLAISDLGLSERSVELLRGMLDRPEGMIILTGPTGSGKTTTIYAMIRELLERENDPASIITLEDPIEAEIHGVTQTSVSGDSDWDYKSALKAALRQDVKTIVVGEMRDEAVTKVTLDAALTGHRVITTFHAGDIASVYARMLHQGFEPFLVASAITAVVTQRLCRRDDGTVVPVVALLVPDDEWRDFVISNPSLMDMRRKLSGHADADLEEVARAMQERGEISDVELRKLMPSIG